MVEPITYVGLDVHKDTIAVALATMGKRGEVREYVTTANTPTTLKTLASKLVKSGATLHFCYEAGPCGYGIQRPLSAAGHDCMVVAPSLIPRRPGECIKIDRRDAANLARLHRAGELTPVWILDRAHEVLIAAATLVAVLGDITRCDNPRQLMAYLGLVPSEHSTGTARRQGAITKAGNGAARRMLIEAAWSYRFPARISRELLLHQEGLAKPIHNTAWKA